MLVNCDMGEGYGIYSFGNDAELMPLVDLANVACGFHASDFDVMRKTIRLAKSHGVAVGAHPSLPDRQGFGRREMAMQREELANCIIYQVGALKGLLEAEGLPLSHIKPHGTLFMMAARQVPVAEALADAADVFRVPLIGLVGTLHETVYKDRGHRLLGEFYSDLDYGEDGIPLVRRSHGDIDVARAADRCHRAFQHGLLRTCAGNDVQVGSETVCIHSDAANATAVARALRNAINLNKAASVGAARKDKALVQ